MKIMIILPIIALLSHASMGQGFNFKDKNIDEIRFSYHDSSVPPPFHRSFTITIKADSVHIVVDSYGNIIADKTFAGSAEQLINIIAVMDSAKIKNGTLPENKGCTGGTGESLVCFSKGSTIFSGNVYHCGGKDSGDLKGDITAVGMAARQLIPDFETVLDRQ
jgi:hypothetical protein